MRALITGAAGFLGRHVARRMLADGFEVTAFDRQVVWEPDIQSVVGDLRDAEAVAATAMNHDVICHIGAIGDVYLAGDKPALASEVNGTGSANVAAAAEQVGARVIYASTWEVYGEPEFQPITEDHPTNPDHPYNITKLTGERLLLAADHLRDVPVVALRLGTAYGSGLRPNSVFRIFIDKARAGEPITIQGDGSQGRQFTHAADIARAFSMAARSELRGIALNTVAPEMTSIKELAETVVARYPTEVTYSAPRPGDVPPATVSASLIKDKLSWETEISFKDGLDELMDDLEANG